MSEVTKMGRKIKSWRAGCGRFARGLGGPIRRLGLAIIGAAAIAAAGGAIPAAAMAQPRTDAINAPPTPQDWQALAQLPDWSGVWTPVVMDQVAQETSNPPPWTPDVAQQMAFLRKEDEEGRPLGLLVGCLPHGMPSWMLITHNAMEILFTPGRVTMLGEGDGNRMRRIYTDGRAHPEDPDLTFHGHSIGRWEGGTLLVDTVGLLPQAWLAISEAVGVPNNGDIHISERIRLVAPDRLEDELTITAPKILSRPWKTTRKFVRQRARKYDIVEGVCQQGSFTETTDSHGNMIFKPVPIATDGSVAGHIGNIEP